MHLLMSDESTAAAGPDGSRRPRRRPPLFRPLRQRDQVLVGAAGLVLCALVGWAASDAGSLPLIGHSGTHYSAYFSEAAGLQPGDEVRVAGVKVGQVTSVSLAGDQVKVGFQASSWVGDKTTASIGIRTLLGAKFLGLSPQGAAEQDPHSTIPQSRTTSPYDVTQALQGLGDTLGSIDQQQLEAGFQALAQTFQNTPPDVRQAVDGLSSLSVTISSRDAQLSQLLNASEKLTNTVSAQNQKLASLIDDGDLLLQEVQSRRDAIHELLTGTTSLSEELTGVVQDNQQQLQPTLDALSRVVGVLQDNQKNLDQVLSLAGPYYTQLNDALGSGRWMDTYICGLVPDSYLTTAQQSVTGCEAPKGGTAK